MVAVTLTAAPSTDLYAQVTEGLFRLHLYHLLAVMLLDRIRRINSCGFVHVLCQEPPEPFTTPNRPLTRRVLADHRNEQDIALALMIALLGDRKPHASMVTLLAIGIIHSAEFQLQDDPPSTPANAHTGRYHHVNSC